MFVRSEGLRRCVASVLGVAGVLLLATAAEAAPRVAVLLPDVQPAVTAELAQRFHDAVTQGWQSTSADAVAAAETRMRLSAVGDLAHCASGPCTQQVAAVLGVGGVIAVHVSALGKDYALKLSLLDRQGQEVARVDDTCDVCTVREVVEALHRAAAKLANDPRTQATPAEAAVTTRVPEPVPPAERPVAPPTPTAQSDDSTPTTSVPPAATTSSPPAHEPTLLWRGLGGGAVALGAIGIGVGIALVVIDGRPTCDLPDPIHSCPQVYNTKGGGAAMLAIGGVALIGGGVFFYLDHRAHTQAQAQPRLSLAPIFGNGTGGQVAAAWDF